MLTWDPVEMLDFFGVVPVEEEYGISHSYEVTKDGLRLLLTIFQYDGDVYISIYRDGVAAPVIDFRLVDGDAARRVRDERGDYVEFGSGRLFGGRYDGDAVIPYGVRIRIEPSISVELFSVPA